jgi:membrane fusion protein (multidrug efflux system)
MGKANNETGTIQFRADFPNPGGLLRHGQTGTVQIHRTQHNAVVIPQRATFEVLDKQYVYVIDKDGVARQRAITVQHEQEDVYVIGAGVGADERFVVEGVREVHDGEKVEVEYQPPDQVLGKQKFRAE